MKIPADLKVPPWVLGAVALVPLAGALIGNSVNTDPLGVASDVTSTIPDRPLDVAYQRPLESSPRLPDHYAMETPEGVIEVAELAFYGRYRDRRATYISPPPEPYDYEADLARLEARWNERGAGSRLDSRAQAALDARQPRMRHDETGRHTANEKPAPVEPDLAVAAPPVRLASADEIGSSARVIDVEAELARRD